MFRFSPIKGGIHPDSHKDHTANRDILTSMPLPERLYLPLFQQAGASALPVVGIGDHVLKGQQIAVTGGGLSAHIHAPTSGKIIAIEDIVAPHPSGLPAPAMVLESDGDDLPLEQPSICNPFTRDPEELATEVEQAGIVGLGGAIFPSAVKLRQGRRFEIKTLIINGGECEPYLTTDDRLMQERAEQIVEGARLIQHIIEAYAVIIAVEDNKPNAIAALKKAAAPHGKLRVAVVPSMYPMGSAKQLIQAVTGEEVPAGMRSNDLGILVHNVATAYAIQQALCFKRPLTSRVVTVGGSCITSPHNVEALFGTPISHLIEYCGGLKREPARLIMGGPMMGQTLPSINTPVMKGTSAILALSPEEVNEKSPDPCIRCSRCVSACPMGLVPLEMAKHVKAESFDGAQTYGLRDCILCGSCSYVCPSHIPLVNYFEYAKGELKNQRTAAQKLAYTQQLTKAREERIEKEAAAKKAAKNKKRRSRDRPASKSTPSSTPSETSSSEPTAENES
ncbi:electron transport complex subunit RsxC [Aurantivibrio plasticivorans]